MIDGLKAYYNFIKKHGSLNGKTPAEQSLIEVDGRNKWITLIQNAFTRKILYDFSFRQNQKEKKRKGLVKTQFVLEVCPVMCIIVCYAIDDIFANIHSPIFGIVDDRCSAISIGVEDVLDLIQIMKHMTVEFFGHIDFLYFSTTGTGYGSIQCHPFFILDVGVSSQWNITSIIRTYAYSTKK